MKTALSTLLLASAILMGSLAHARACTGPGEAHESNAASVREKLIAMNLPGIDIGQLSDEQIECINLDGLEDNAKDLVREMLVDLLIKNAETILKKEFPPPWHGYITKAMRYAKRIKMGLSGPPPIIVIPGPWGYGKTYFVDRLKSVLGVGQRYAAYQVTKDEVEFPISAVRKMAANEAEVNPQLAIAYISEVGQAAHNDDLLPGASHYTDEYLAKILGRTVRDNDKNSDNRSTDLTDEDRRSALRILRKASIEEARNALGTGTYIRKPGRNSKSIPEYMRELTALLTDFQGFASLPENQKTELSPGKLRARAVQVLENFYKEHPTAFSGIPFESASKMFDMFLDKEGGEALAQSISLNAESFSSSVERVSHVMIIMDFNPDNLLEESMARAAAQGPDALNRDMLENITSQRLQVWWRSLWGNDPAFESRLGVSNWEMMPAYTHDQWMSLFRQRFEFLNAVVNSKIAPLDFSTRFSVGDDVFALFAQQYIDTSRNGTRPYYLNGETGLQVLGTNIRLALMERRAELAKTNVHLHFSVRPDTKILEVSIATDVPAVDKKTPATVKYDLIAEEDFTVTQEIVDPQEQSREEQDRVRMQSLHLAANAIVGSYMLGSMPMQLKRQTSYGDTLFENGWQTITPNHATENVRAVMAQSGMAASRIFFPNRFSPEFMDADLAVIKNVVRNLLEDVNRQIERLGFVRKTQADNQQDRLNLWKERFPLFARYLSNLSYSAENRDLVAKPRTSFGQFVGNVTRSAMARIFLGPKPEPQVPTSLAARGITREDLAKILPGKIFNADFYEAILAIQDLDNPKDPNYRKAISILYESAEDILKTEQPLFSTLYNTLMRQDEIGSDQLKDIVTKYMVSPQVRARLLSKVPGSMAYVSDPILYQPAPVNVQRPLRRRAIVNNFRRFLTLSLGVASTMAFPSYINESQQAQYCQAAQLLDSKGVVAQVYTDKDRIQHFIASPNYHVTAHDKGGVCTLSLIGGDLK